MIVFHNPGLIEANAIRLMGASVKEEGSFGRFGTGIKYAVATVLRGGGSVVIYSGDKQFTFAVEKASLKGKDFDEVVLINPGANLVENRRIPLGFTTRLGKDWEPWMAAREFGCNARDEGGDWGIWCPGELEPENFQWDYGAGMARECTRVVVEWPAMEEALASDENHVFAPEGQVLLEERGVRVMPGPSDYLYHRGVRVWKLPKPGVFTYDILDFVDLTEDRTVKYSFCVVAQVRNLMLQTDGGEVIAGAVGAAEGTWEAGFDWTGQQWEPHEPKEAWLEQVSRLREARHPVSKSAADVMLKHSAFVKAEAYGGGTYKESSGAFAEVVDELEDMGLDMKGLRVFVTQELPDNALSTLRGGAVYVTPALLDEVPGVVARELLRRRLETLSGGEHDRLLEAVLPLILKRNWDWTRDLKGAEKEDA